MPTIDLGPPRPGPRDLLDGLPRRAALTLPELTYVAAAAGGAPLPFDAAGPEDSALDPPGDRSGNRLGNRLGDRPNDRLEDRLGGADAERAAYLRTLERLRDPADSLARRGLLVDETVDRG